MVGLVDPDMTTGWLISKCNPCPRPKRTSCASVASVAELINNHTQDSILGTFRGGGRMGG